MCEGTRADLAVSFAAAGLAGSGAACSSASGAGSRFTRDLRAASWKVGSAAGSSAIGTGLARTISIGATAGRGSPAPIPEAAPCGSTGSVASPSTAAIESLFDTEAMDRARSANDFAAYAMLAWVSYWSAGPSRDSQHGGGLWWNCGASSFAGRFPSGARPIRNWLPSALPASRRLRRSVADRPPVGEIAALRSNNGPVAQLD